MAIEWRVDIYFHIHINPQQVNNGKEVTDGLVIFAELLSTFKHGLSRVLVLVICMGYGIVKPR